MEFLLTTLGKLWLGGAPVDWSRFYFHERRHRVSLPTYPFERQRYWIEPPKPTDNGETIPGTSPGPTLPRKKTRIADWFYIPSWKRSVSAPPAREISGRRSWLVFIDDCGLGAKLVERLKQDGHDVITVTAGSEFRILSETEFSLTPGQRDHYDTLLRQIPAPARTPTTVVHLWSLTPPAQTEPGLPSINQAQDLGFYSLLFLAQALGSTRIQSRFAHRRDIQ